MTVAHQPTPVWKLEKYALLLLTISFGMKLTFSFVILSRHCALSNEIQYSSANKQTMHTLAANTFTRSDSPECPFSSTLVPPECDSRTFPENVRPFLVRWPLWKLTARSQILTKLQVPKASLSCQGSRPHMRTLAYFEQEAHCTLHHTSNGITMYRRKVSPTAHRLQPSLLLKLNVLRPCS